MNQQSNNSTDRGYDVSGRLSSQDKGMMAQVSMRRFDEDSKEASSKGSSPAPNARLSTTPQDTSFMTEENLKKIYMPKRIQF